MPFEPITPQKLSKAVTRQIEWLILRGILRPGTRLPSERELSERLGVSRPSLREALQDMQKTGLLQSRHGSGVFVTEDINAIFPAPLAHLLSQHKEAGIDLITFRRDIESIAVERAARYGSDTDLKVIDDIHQRMLALRNKQGDAEIEAGLDIDFHMAIIEAAHNVVMLHVMRSMYSFMRDALRQSRDDIFDKPALRDELLDHHDRINTALQSRDAKEARSAMMSHLDFVEKTMRAQAIAQDNEYIARKKYRQQIQRDET